MGPRLREDDGTAPECAARVSLKFRSPARASVMPTLRDVIAGPWRAVLVLGVTQILAWGAIYYTPVLTVPLIAAERGWSMTFSMGDFRSRCSPPGSCPRAWDY